MADSWTSRAQFRFEASLRVSSRVSVNAERI